MTCKVEPGIQPERMEQFKNPRLQHVFHFTKKMNSILPTGAELVLPPDKDNIRKTSHRPRQIGRRDIQAHGRLAPELTCDEADVDELLSAGELT
jgi:hypothetical protein